MFTHILMPTDGAEHSENAIKRGIELAKLCGAKVTAIHVLPDYRLAISDDGSFDQGLHGKMEAEARDRGRDDLAYRLLILRDLGELAPDLVEPPLDQHQLRPARAFEGQPRREAGAVTSYASR